MATAQVKVKAPESTKTAPRPAQKKWEFVKAPTHPGEVLLEAFMQPLKLTVEELAARTGYSVSFIDALTRKEERVSEAFAQALSREFGTTHKFWLNLQQFTDDFAAKQATQ